MGEGIKSFEDGLCTLEPKGRTAVAIIGGTGYVGRLLARRLLSHPTLCLGPIVGSKRSEGMVFQDVWEEKEAALMKNYGSQLWTSMPFPPELAGVRVSSLDELVQGDCKVAVSCVAPDVGYIEDILVNAGCKVFSISPYKRMENLTIPEVNPERIPASLDQSLFKSPNCVSVGTSIALKAISDAYGIEKCSVCTFQSLSGRGDAMYPAELVQGNVYPLWGTKEKTEVYIGNEIRTLLKLDEAQLSVRAHRVGVHVGHFVDVRVQVKAPEMVGSVADVQQMFDSFSPLGQLAGKMASLPEKPILVEPNVGGPRPASHNNAFGGMQVVVGNIKIEDRMWHVCFSLVVNNMVRGAYGAALLMAEYYLYLKSHPAETRLILAAQPAPTSSSPHPASPALASPSPDTTPMELAGPALDPIHNTLVSSAAVREAKSCCAADPGAYHGTIARRMLHWFHPAMRAWLTWEPSCGRWTGWDEAGRAVELNDEWTPWQMAFDGKRAPYYEWFVGGCTSAAFNEVDRHVLAGHGEEDAFIGVDHSALTSAVQGVSLAPLCSRLSRRQLLVASVVAAMVLRNRGVSKGDRVVLLLPNTIEHRIWVQAAKRIGAIYLCLPITISIPSLAERSAECGAKLVITSMDKAPLEGASLKAVALSAVSSYVPVASAFATVRRVLQEKLSSENLNIDVEAVCAALEYNFEGRVAVRPSEVATKLEVLLSMQPEMRIQAAALVAHSREEMHKDHSSKSTMTLLVLPAAAGGDGVNLKEGSRTSSANDLAAVDGGHSKYPKYTEGSSIRSCLPRTSSALTSAHRGNIAIVSADEAYAQAEAAVLSAASVATMSSLTALDDPALVVALWRSVPPLPLPSNHPKNIVYTSGTSGHKAKGLVCDTGGYCAGVSYTMEVVFDVRAGTDVMYVDADPSWITGQTYGISGPLCCRATSLVVHGLRDDALIGNLPQNFVNLVTQLGVTLHVSSASFLKRLLRDPVQTAWLKKQHIPAQLRVAASCGEPLMPPLHQAAQSTVCRYYINSYWASEHGSIILAHCFGNFDQPLRGDARMFAMPWVDAAVWLPKGTRQPSGRKVFSEVKPARSQLDIGSEKGRLVTKTPWPSMARTVWGDSDAVGTPGWLGDLETYHKTYWSTFETESGTPIMALDLADLAQAWADGSLSVLGHSREALRLGSSKVSSAELETTMLHASADISDCVVVGVPDKTDGSLQAVACLVLQDKKELTESLVAALKKNVHIQLGEACVPAHLVRVAALPRTHNSKVMRNVVQQFFLTENGDVADLVSEIANPSCLLELRAAVDEWRSEQAMPVLDEAC